MARSKARRGRDNGIVRDYLERVSWRLLDQYRTNVARFIRGKAGVYALYRGDHLYYVGLAKNLMSRVSHHLKDRHAERWDRFSVYLTVDDSHTRPLEALLLRIVDPGGNRVKGRLKGASDLGRKLDRDIANDDADRRAVMMGAKAVQRRRRSKTRRIVGTIALSGLVEKSRPLIGSYKGVVYRARLRKDGRIAFKGKLFDNPTAAAKAIENRTVNGWAFWRIGNTMSSRTTLSSLRR